MIRFCLFVASIVVFLFISPSVASAALIKDFSKDTIYNIRIDGAVAGDSLGRYMDIVADFNNNGKNDILVGATAGYNGASSGSFWIIYDDILDNYQGKGNTLDLNNSANYNIRVDGPSASTFLGWDSAIATGNLDNDGRLDIAVTAAYTDFNSRNNSGSVYILYSSLLSTFTGTGNIVSLATTSNFNVRFDGPIANAAMSDGLMLIADVNNDGVNDLVFGAEAASYNSRNSSGSVYVLYSSILNTFSGTGNTVDMATTTNFNLRFDGAAAGDLLTFAGAAAADMNGDGLKDLVLNASARNSGAGSVYLIYSSIYSGLSGVGNTIDLNSSSSYNIRYDGAAAGDNLGLLAAAPGDLNNNARNDLVLGAFLADNNSKTESGSIYLINDALIISYGGTGNNVLLSSSSTYNARFDGAAATNRLGLWMRLGDVDTDGALDLISPAYSASSNGISGSGSLYIFYNPILQNYNAIGQIVDLGITENFSVRYDGAAVNDLLGSGGYDFGDLNNDGLVDLLLPARLQDNNGRLDSGSVYVIYADSRSTANIQSPSSRQEPEIRAFMPGKSGANGVISTLVQGTFPWDAYLYVEKTPRIGIKRINNIYWQTSAFYDIWWRSQFNNAKLIEPLKPYNILISYDVGQLDSHLKEKNLKIALSEDQGKTWKIMLDSYVDLINKTVGISTKKGGLFTLVSRH